MGKPGGGEIAGPRPGGGEKEGPGTAPAEFISAEREIRAVGLARPMAPEFS